MNKINCLLILILLFSAPAIAGESLKFGLIEKPHWGPTYNVTVEFSQNKLWINGSQTDSSIIPSLIQPLSLLSKLKLEMQPGCSGSIIKIEKVIGLKKSTQLGCLDRSFQTAYRQAINKINALSEREKRLRAN